MATLLDYVNEEQLLITLLMVSKRLLLEQAQDFMVLMTNCNQFNCHLLTNLPTMNKFDVWGNAFKEYQAIVTHNSILMDKQELGKSGVVGSLPNLVFCD
jgi:hypothetical protein